MCVIHKYFGTVEKTADIANVNRRKNVLLMEGLFGFSEKKNEYVVSNVLKLEDLQLPLIKKI